MFTGFTERTYEFFMAIRFNNNVDFFRENRAWYEQAVRQPLRELAASLAPAVEALDPLLERRPEKTVSRINRDIRFSRDKSPYRDHMWLSFRRPGAERDSALSLYFDISCDELSCGMGIYRENRPLMNGLRRNLRLDSASFLEAARPALTEFSLHGDRFKRMKIPDGLPDEAKAWYALKGFYIEKTLPSALALSSALTDEIARGFELFAPLYRYVSLIQPVENDEP